MAPFAEPWAEGKVEVAFCLIAMAVHRQQLIFLPDALASLVRRFKKRPVSSPDFGSNFAAMDVAPWIVVKEREFGAHK